MIYHRLSGGIPTDLLKNSRIILLRNLPHVVNKRVGDGGREGME